MRAAAYKLKTKSSLLLALLAIATFGCVHVAQPRPLERGALQRRLQILEAAHAAFCARDLSRSESGLGLGAEESIAEYGDAFADLLRLRMRYLRLLSSADRGQRALILIRMAELHLDLAARGRRLPYPAGADERQKRAFDDRLSRMVLAVEATGIGIARQLTLEPPTRAARFAYDRAWLYLRLHDSQSPLSRAESDTLARELARVSWRAPKRLLETGRVGRRASR